MLRLLNRSEMKEISFHQMLRDFPEDERKPWSWMENEIQKGRYFACGCFAEEQLQAYAFFVGIRGEGNLLLDYFAVEENCRDQGIGSKVLAQIRQFLKKNQGLLIEVENPVYAKNRKEREQQLRRIAFYQRNGVQVSDTGSCLFGVEYRILYLPLTVQKPDSLKKSLQAIYEEMFAGRSEVYQIKKL